MPDLYAWLIAAIALFFGSCLQSCLGFGMATVAAPIIVIIRPEWIPVTLSINALLVSAIFTWNEREFLEIKQMAVPMVTRIPGSLAGGWLLIHLSIVWLQILVSVTVMTAVLISLFSKKFHATRANLSWAAFASGLMGTTTSIGGPPMALVMQYGPPQTVRANLSLYFTYGCVLSMISYAIVGVLSWQLILESISFFPCVLLGSFLGVNMRGYFDAGRFRPILLILCSLAALFALVGAYISSNQ